MAQYVDALKANLGIDRLVLYAADLSGDRGSCWWRPAQTRRG